MTGPWAVTCAHVMCCFAEGRARVFATRQRSRIAMQRRSTHPRPAIDCRQPKPYSAFSMICARAGHHCGRIRHRARPLYMTLLVPSSARARLSPRVFLLHPSFIAPSHLYPHRMAPKPTPSADKPDKASARRPQRIVLRPLPPLVLQSATSRLTIQLSTSTLTAAKIASRIAPSSNEARPSSTCGSCLCDRGRVSDLT